ncbi:MAG: hypothetical protein KF803_14145, partial [Cyclobacteriaceae bacterium]|nr:hypothetical protein [Cyclobacteriaceae bacterium]
MLTQKRSVILVQNAVLIFLAAFIASIVFLVDLHSDTTVSVASMYAIVILYSWLLPGKRASIYTASICTFLTIFAASQSQEMNVNPNELSKVNIIISLVVIWICVMMVFIAKSGFSSLESINNRLTESSAALLEKVKELDEQQQELTEHKLKLEKLNADLIVKNRELERFTSITSHDLQEPLRTIGNMTQLIARKYYATFDDQGKKILDYVTNATTRMTVMIKGLLEFSRIGNKRETERVDCMELLYNIVLDFDATLKASQGTITFHELPAVKGNPVELRMLFQNLISNGLKFRKADTPPVIEVSAKDNSDYVAFCVK